LGARTREALLDRLGRWCRWCGTTEQLTFDTIIPTLEGHKSEHHRRFDWSWRMSFYRWQLAAGNLQVLCVRCNSAKGDAIIFYENELHNLDLPAVIPFAGQPF
jgi:5-methylcytosine-specific restriction endonuclease McrA